MSPAEVEARRRALRVAAAAEVAELEPLIGDSAAGATWLRAPEVGLVLVRGRIGGDGRAFNLGEATVTRAAVRLASGEVGHGHVLGRASERARLSALVDALRQVPDHRDRIDRGLDAIAQRLAAAADLKRRRIAATRVDFFTLARGD